MDKHRTDPATKTARMLTLAAILPQWIFMFTAMTDSTASWTAPVTAFAYAAFIFSFLGGYWWGVALTTPNTKPVIFFMAVVPMLISFALFLPWIFGLRWPGPQLIILGLLVTAAYLVDRRLLAGMAVPPDWLQTRLIASIGLGVPTIVIGFLTKMTGYAE